MRVKQLFEFIVERELVRAKKERGDPRPWTQDPILQQYRFCNVYREYDPVTKWIAANWRDPYADWEDVWFAMVIARFLNLPGSLEALDLEKHVLQWDPKSFKKIMRLRRSAGERLFNSAYMIRCDCQDKTGHIKTDYLADRVFTPLWKDRQVIRPRPGDKLKDFYARLRNYRDMGPFMTGQVLADCKFTEVLQKAEDWWVWAAPGPGSKKGLNWVVERDAKTPWKDEDWVHQLTVLQTKIDPLIREAQLPRLSAQDLQNCLCEVWKWARLRYNLGGRPKQRYPGA